MISSQLPLDTPRISPLGQYTCFSCRVNTDKIFAKINRGSLQYVMCKPDCLSIALTRLGLIVGDDRAFTSPVNITVRNSPSAFVNVTRSPISRSPGSSTLHTIEDASDEADETTPQPQTRDMDVDIEEIATKIIPTLKRHKK